MQSVATTRLSTKGQVVIPEDVRARLGLRAGARFVVVAEDDVVILKTLTPPSMKDFDRLVRVARQQAKSSGLKRSDVSKAVASARERE